MLVDTIALSVETIALLLETIALSAETIALLLETIALLLETIALSADAIICRCYLILRDGSSMSVRHCYLQNAIAQVDNTTNGTGYHA
ncbi:hypothetical protein [uncultured Nostoc sp.]|uniref:hypothetical protein n=1 Tax=uncultured Nostoc sp. TaxID=340711 RepID=UPI0035C9DCEA